MYGAGIPLALAKGAPPAKARPGGGARRGTGDAGVRLSRPRAAARPAGSAPIAGERRGRGGPQPIGEAASRVATALMKTLVENGFLSAWSAPKAAAARR